MLVFIQKLRARRGGCRDTGPEGAGGRRGVRDHRKPNSKTALLGLTGCSPGLSSRHAGLVSASEPQDALLREETESLTGDLTRRGTRGQRRGRPLPSLAQGPHAPS